MTREKANYKEAVIHFIRWNTGASMTTSGNMVNQYETDLNWFYLRDLNPEATADIIAVRALEGREPREPIDFIPFSETE